MEMKMINMAPNSIIASPNKPFWCEIFDPQSNFVKNCNQVLLSICLFGLYVDALLLYLPIVDDHCAVKLEHQLIFCIVLLRSIGDSFLLLNMVLKFRTGMHEGASNSPFGKRTFVKEPRIIALTYLKSGFIIDFLASLPLPQAYLLYHILTSKLSQATTIYEGLIWIFQIQFFARVLTTLFVYMKIEKIAGIAIRSPWSGTLYILLVYGSISHYVGALYYFMYIYDVLYCMEKVFQEDANATMQDLDQLLSKCSLKNGLEETLSSDALANKICSRSFTQKYMFCFSWGLKTLSSMGQNLKSNAALMDTIFNFSITIIGLMVFADLIARMQTCMQSVGEQEEQEMIRQRELEEWTDFHQLPPNLKKHVLQTAQSQLHAARGSNDETILNSLPIELHCQIREHFYLGLVQNLPVFKGMDDQLLHAVCGHLRTFTGSEGMYVVLEGDPVQKLLFICSGQLELFTIDGGSSSTNVGPGEICGQELLSWCSQSSSSTQNLPSSTCTVKCVTDVEAFSLPANDLKLLAIQFDHDCKFFDGLSCHSFKVNC